MVSPSKKKDADDDDDAAAAAEPSSSTDQQPATTDHQVDDAKKRELKRKSSPATDDRPPSPAAPPTTSGDGEAAAPASSSPAAAAAADDAAATPETDAKHRRKKPRAKVKETVIDHTYRDFSRVKVAADDDEIALPEELRELDGGDGEAATGGGKGNYHGTNKHSQKNRPNFPAKLHSIVSDPAYGHIICWLVSSCAFDIACRCIVNYCSTCHCSQYLTDVSFSCNTYTIPASWEKLEDCGKF